MVNSHFCSEALGGSAAVASVIISSSSRTGLRCAWISNCLQCHHSRCEKFRLKQGLHLINKQAR